MHPDIILIDESQGYIDIGTTTDGITYTTDPYATDPNAHLINPAGYELTMTQMLVGIEFRARVRSAAFKAPRVYTGPVGKLLSSELTAWESFGYRFGGGNLMTSLVEDIETKWALQQKETYVAPTA